MADERMVKLNVERTECLVREPGTNPITDLMRPDPTNYESAKCDKVCTFALICKRLRGMQ